MKVEELWKTYDFYTAEITKHARYLGFAGLAVCWFFKSPEVTFPTLILLALLSLVLFFLFDLLQYYVAAVRYRSWLHGEESQAVDTGIELGSLDLWPTQELDRPAQKLFTAKLVLLLLGFVLIGAELMKRIF